MAQGQRTFRNGTCTGCGTVTTLLSATQCRTCYRRAPASVQCMRCGIRRPPVPGDLRLCSACRQRDPARTLAWLEPRIGRFHPRLASAITVLAAELGELCDPKTARRHLLVVERLCASQPVSTTTELIAELHYAPDHHTTATLVEGILARRELVVRPQRSTVDTWRRQHLDRIPDPFRPAVEAFVESQIAHKRRSSLYGTAAISDRQINNKILVLATFSRHLHDKGLGDWSNVNAAHVEAFLTVNIGQRLTALRDFFAFARRRKLILVNPTSEVARKQPFGYQGRIVTIAEQRVLLRRWSNPGTDPRERVVGLLCLLHAASNKELRHLLISDVDLTTSTVRIGRRPLPISLDPYTVDAIEECLAQRAATTTYNPHLLLTHTNRLHDRPCSVAYPLALMHRAGFTPQQLRQTRISALAHQLDPRAVADALAVTKETVLRHLTGPQAHTVHTFHRLSTETRES